MFSPGLRLPGSADIDRKIHVGPWLPGHVGKRGWRAEGQPPSDGAGKPVGMCEVIPGTNNTAKLARPVPHPSSEAIPVTQRIPHECEATFTPETAPTESAVRKPRVLERFFQRGALRERAQAL